MNFQNVYGELSLITKVLSGPEIHGDERDGVVAKLNQFLAAMGTGKGYYQPLRSTRPTGMEGMVTGEGMPCEFKKENIFHRLKGVIYNRLSQYKNADGMVSLILNASNGQYESDQERQRVLDIIKSILQVRHPVHQGGPQMTIHPKLVSIIPRQDNQIEFIVCVRESGKGIWTATFLFSELMHVEGQVKENLPCEKIVPRTEIGKNELDEYFSRPPPGFEEKWTEAVANNPNPLTLLPVPIRGFEELIKRQKCQLETIEVQSKMIGQLIQRMEDIEWSIHISRGHYASRKEVHRSLSHRLIRVLAMLILTRKHGSVLDVREEELQCRLEAITVHLSGSGKLGARLDAILQALSRVDLSTLNKRLE